MNLIFDFDGTLSDSLSDAVKIANKFLEKEGKKIISSNEVRQKGVKKLILESKVPKYKIPKLILFGRRKIKEKIPKQKSFKNLPQIIVKLSKSHKLGIITTNSQKNVQVFLNHSRLNYFDFIHSEIDLFGKHKKLKKISVNTI